MVLSYFHDCVLADKGNIGPGNVKGHRRKIEGTEGALWGIKYLQISLSLWVSDPVVTHIMYKIAPEYAIPDERTKKFFGGGGLASPPDWMMMMKRKFV